MSVGADDRDYERRLTRFEGVRETGRNKRRRLGIRTEQDATLDEEAMPRTEFGPFCKSLYIPDS